MKKVKFTKSQNERLKFLTEQYFEINDGLRNKSITPREYAVGCYDTISELQRNFGSIEPLYSVLMKEYEIQNGKQPCESKWNIDNNFTLKSYYEEFKIAYDAYKSGIFSPTEFSQKTIDLIICIISAFGTIEPYYSEFKKKAGFDPLEEV
ncbi:MAG TPA: hypothetical protein PKY29_06100 [Ferruginibacter sp.]|nr:hypothetical protein [Ferruginibacter sp.]HRQ20868.1 hypothetical protein [Ferruginibacter sp.]